MGRACLSYINHAVSEVKSKLNEPFIILAGDFNQWDIANALTDFVDVKEVDVGLTRGNCSIDRTFTNIEKAVAEKGTVPPLSTNPDPDTGDVCYSDHHVTYAKLRLDRLRTFEWLSYTYRYYNPESEAAFVDWCRSYDWSLVLTAKGSNKKAEAYQEIVTQAMDVTFFSSLGSPAP